MNGIQRLKGWLAKDKKIVAAYLFGSRASGRVSSTSDTDIALLLENRYREKAFDLMLKYKNEMEAFLSANADVVILNVADPFLRFQVYLKGKLLYLRSAKKANAFRIRSLYEYWDILPIKKMAEERSIQRLFRHAH